MSILRLEAAPFAPIDSTYIQSVDLEICNVGTEGFEMLVHGYGEQGLFYVQLIHVGSGSTVPLYHMMTEHKPFQLVLVTNVNDYTHTAVTVRVRNQGNLVALFTQEDMFRMI
ncbi:hypothetical protein NYE48_21025 [Paenibacillus sp. FSL M7-1455]|uniref:Uncharacterized protein n=1 Tax=Paenibacillus cookii TaxID=157839 RepID=A0ABQ4LSD0_9BACL|nr:hypothetical protein [Paenibacillus cookii]KHF32453.1 hypothetical protein CM49_05327 [Paenibacillus sp. P1XP2]GIO66192.1 hypothetical protein J21TS3_10130 [Paenibacillus cookii]